MEHKVMTAPLAIIKINSVTVGKMKNVRVTENLRRGRVSGIGELIVKELPVIEWSGSLSCSSYSINFNKLLNESNIGTFRNLGNVEAWKNALLLQEVGIQVELLRKVKDGEIDAETGAVNTRYETYAVIKEAFVTREGFDLQEGQISGRDTEFEYLEPILYQL